MENNHQIEIKYYKLGNDLVFHIFGGVAHIGATALAYWHDGQISVSMEELPHHKEGELAKELAMLTARTLKKTTSVIMGIHIDNASKEEIDDIVDYVRIEMKSKIKELGQGKY